MAFRLIDIFSSNIRYIYVSLNRKNNSYFDIIIIDVIQFIEIYFYSRQTDRSSPSKSTLHEYRHKTCLLKSKHAQRSY